MISVIVPVMNEHKITDEFFNYVSKNTLIPDDIILIDNGSTPSMKKIVDKYKNLNIRYVRHENNIGVNPAWIEGLKMSKHNIVSILNNDIVFGKYFFETIVKTMNEPNIGYCVPTTIGKAGMIQEVFKVEKPNKPLKLEEMRMREGWAFTIRKDIIEKHGHIPEPLKIWFGDNYLFQLVQVKEKMKCVRILSEPIIHYESITFNKNKKDFKIEEEHKFWLEYIEKNNFRVR